MNEPLPNITAGVEALRRDNPWPELPADVDPFYLSLDAGGRHLVTDVIRDKGITLMVEVGCFLCGSTRQWLEAAPDLAVIGVDPWDGNWSVYVRKGMRDGNRIIAALEDPSAIADTIQRYGNYALALNNIRDHRDRFIPVRQRSPEALHYLKRRGIEPQLIYIDAFKSDEDLWVAHDLFPRSILCGDDWTWPDEDGRFLMREHVQRFAAEKGFGVESADATWIVSTGRSPAPRGPRPWDAGAVALLLQEIDSTATRLLQVVTTAARAGRAATFDEVTRELDCGAEELLQATKQINSASAGRDRPQALGLGGTGGSGWDTIGPRPYVIAEGLPALLAEAPAGG